MCFTPAISVLSLNPTTSTTSVSPSQCPTELPSQVGIEVLAVRAAERNDPEDVVRLVENHDDVVPLHDLERIRRQRRARHARRQALRALAEILRPRRHAEALGAGFQRRGRHEVDVAAAEIDAREIGLAGRRASARLFGRAVAAATVRVVPAIVTVAVAVFGPPVPVT